MPSIGSHIIEPLIEIPAIKQTVLVRDLIRSYALTRRKAVLRQRKSQPHVTSRLPVEAVPQCFDNLLIGRLRRQIIISIHWPSGSAMK